MPESRDHGQGEKTRQEPRPVSRFPISREPEFGATAELIRELANLLQETGLGEIEIETRTSGCASPGKLSMSPAVVGRGERHTSMCLQVRPLSAAAAPETADFANHPGVVTSPMVGTAYLAPAPGTPPFRRDRQGGEGRPDAPHHRGDEDDEPDPGAERRHGSPRSSSPNAQPVEYRRAAADHRVADVRQDPDRQPGRDRASRHARLPRARHRRPSPCIRRPMPTPCMSGWPMKACASARRRRATAISTFRRSLRPARSPAPRRSIRAMASCPRMPASPRSSRSTASPSSGPSPEHIRMMGDKIAAKQHRQGARHPARAGLGRRASAMSRGARASPRRSAIRC